MARLGENSALLRADLAAAGIAVPASPAPIVPVVIGGAGETLRVAARLMEAGFFASGIRPPAVPNGTSRIRLTLMARHGRDQIAGLTAALAAALAGD